MKKIQSFQRSDERYRSLRVIGLLFGLIGTVLMAGGAFLLAVSLYALAWGTWAAPRETWVRSGVPRSTCCRWFPGCP